MSRAEGGTSLSVVIAAWHGQEEIETALDALRRAAADIPPKEILVVRGAGLVADGWLASAHPEVRELVLPAGSPVPVLRSHGLASASGDRVALLEDHCPVEPGWLAALRSAMREHPDAIIGGPVRQVGEHPALSWGVYLLDYAWIDRSWRPEADGRTTGCNTSLPRPVIDRLAETWVAGFVETAIWEATEQAGLEGRIDDTMTVSHRGRYRWGDAITQSWHHGRDFGAWRVRNASVGIRTLRALAGIPLLAWLPLRTAWHARRGPWGPGRVARSLPALVALLWAWVGGEAFGAVLGPGRSRDSWS